MVGKGNVAILKENNLECEWTVAAFCRFILEKHVLPFHDQLVSVIKISDLGIMSSAGVKVCHERSNVLSSGQPGVDIVSSVEEASRGNGYVLHRVTIEWELEAEVDGGGSPVAL